VGRPASPPPGVRRLADVLLACLAASAPLSISGMQIAMGTLGILALVGIPLRWRVVRRTPLDGWLALFFGVCALSTLASGHPLEAAGWPRPPWLLLAYFVGYWWLRDREHARRVALVVVAAGAVAGAYGVLQHFTGVDWYRWAVGRATRVRPRIPGAEGFAVVGFFRNYLTYAHAMVFPLTWAGALALRGSILGMVAAVLLTLAIVFSTARGVWIGAVGGGVLLGLLSGRRGLGLVAAGAVVAAMAVAVSPGLRAQAAPVFTLGGVNAGRAAIYRANLEIIHDHPLLGLGFGRYKIAALPYYDRHPDADRRSHAHSNVLQIAAEAGLLGLAAFCLLFAVILRRGFDAVCAATDGGQWATAAGAWVGIATFFLAGLTQYSFGDAEVVIPMWLATAVLMRCADSV
jgi:putative inorganic carbon (HCO3(-)) transporter